MRKTIFPSLVPLTLLLCSCAVGAATVQSKQEAYAPGEYDNSVQREAAPKGAEPPSAAVGSNDTSSSSISLHGPSDRIVLYSASLNLVVNDPADVAQKITDMAFAKGGWVVSSNVYQSVNGPRGEKYYSGAISIRVPAESSEKLKATLSEIEAFAVEVKSRQLTGEDVTSQYVDVESRLRNLRASQARLIKIMENAEDTEAIAAVEAQLRQVENEIEMLEGQLNYFKEASQYALISITLEPYIPSQPIEIGGWHPEGVAKQAFETLIRALQSLVDLLIQLAICGIPALLLIGLSALPFVLYGRHLVRRSRKSNP
jgi:glycine cleavage system regulatory protein